MVYNAVECCNTAAVYVKTSKALPFGRALFVIPEGELIMAVSYKKLWKLLIDKDIKKKDLSAINHNSSAKKLHITQKLSFGSIKNCWKQFDRHSKARVHTRAFIIQYAIIRWQFSEFGLKAPHYCDTIYCRVIIQSLEPCFSQHLLLYITMENFFTSKKTHPSELAS